MAGGAIHFTRVAVGEILDPHRNRDPARSDCPCPLRHVRAAYSFVIVRIGRVGSLSWLCRRLGTSVESQ